MRSSKSWLSRHRNGAVFSFFAVVLTAVVCAGILGGTSYALSGPFAEADARLDEAKGGAQRRLLFPDASSFEEQTAPKVDGLNSVYKADTGEYVFDVTSGEGYGGDLQLLVGINADGTVAGIQVVSSKETDGIGSNALTEEHFGTLTGLNAQGTLTIDDAKTGETHVDGVSGATFTSRAVVDCLNIAFEGYAQMGGN